MLQIARATAFLLFVLALCLRVEAGTAAAVDWVLEDGLDEPYLALPEPQVLTPEELKLARQHYAQGNYRVAATQLQVLDDAHLPDGQADLVNFMLAECRRQMGLHEYAMDDYRYVVDRFPEGNFVPPSLFRILQYAYLDRNQALADSIMDVFEGNYKIHPLYNSVVYTIGKLYYRTERYGEAVELLMQIPRRSIRHYQAQFLAALALLRVNNEKKALLILEYLRKNVDDQALLSEVNIVMGDVYFSRDNYRTAQNYYRSIPSTATRHDYALARMARVYLALEEYDRARDLASDYIRKNRHSEYFLDMASILEQTHAESGDELAAAQINGLVYKRIVDVRYAYEAEKELARVYDVIRSWRRIQTEALMSGDSAEARVAQLQIDAAERLEAKCRRTLRELGANVPEDPDRPVPGLAERRYITMLHRNRDTLNASLSRLQKRRKTLAADITGRKADSAGVAGITTLDEQVDSIQDALESNRQEYLALKRASLDRDEQAERRANEMQAKFIDWTFMRYLDRKAELAQLNAEIAARQHEKDTVTDSLGGKGAAVASLFASRDRDQVIEGIKESRQSLIHHIFTILESSLNNPYVPEILFRLAELYYDEASDDFDRRLRAFEAAMARGDDTAGVDFPEYDLSRVIAVYDRIIREYPQSWTADDAYFYKAMALHKVGKEEEANRVLLAMIEDYPESEFFVEANMTIGRHYFEHPQTEGGKGYQLAEEAYRRVLYYRDHPQFVQALYHLGWCYYMQDQYEEAIAVFKYLVEEVDLDFDAERMEEKQLVNPLLREEAIDFIAISFDERGDIQAAIDFLGLIGNDDYAALVIKRIAELREEDLDYQAAISIYERLLKEYGRSIIAPQAAINLIKVYESINNSQEAMLERERFLQRYANGTEWHRRLVAKDPERIVQVDSLAIAVGLSVADEQFRTAEQQGSTENYERAAENYGRIVAAYPDHPRAAEARWNFAAILDTKLNKKRKAFEEYLRYSRSEDAHPERRRQAALNAVAIAQSALPADSAVEKGKLEPVAVKLLEAGENYLELFPKGKQYDDVVLSMGAVFFNRRMFTRAIETYKRVTDRGPETTGYHNARFFMAQSLFGQEKWVSASEAFREVYDGTRDMSQREEAYKLMLQSMFLYAKQLFEAGDYQKAADAYEQIEKRYPGSEYGDVVLFNAAESYEKLEQWDRACKSYYALFESYPSSRLAPDALFNAASDYEKAGKFDKAAEAYETLASRYPDHQKAKDALFNVGFCYEKLGKLEKMAEANERYTLLYPGEADVEAMLLRSAQFYFRAEMYHKAIRAYRNFASRYNKSPRSVEALYLIGEAYLKQDDQNNATMFYAQAEQQNKRLMDEGREANVYYAAEAAYRVASLKSDEFDELDFNVAPDQLKQVQRRKSELLTDAAKAYQRVMQYQSERMFEAGYRIGEMYEEYATDWKEQRRTEKDPIKAAVAERDIHTAASRLLQNAFAPYRKVLELGAQLDSLGETQKRWIDSAAVALGLASVASGEYQLEAVAAMQDAPIPREIRDQPLYLFQYLKQVLETLEPMKIQARDYFLSLHRSLEEVGLSGTASTECAMQFARLNFLIPNDYDALATRILKTADKLPDNLAPEEREEMIFQMEDMVFELQDKAIFGYEDALEKARSENMTGNRWSSKILQALARLSPDTYGTSFYLATQFSTDKNWLVRADSVENWNSHPVPDTGWYKARQVGMRYMAAFPKGDPKVIWGGPEGADRLYLWYPMHVNGMPRDGTLYYVVTGAYRLYVNGILVKSDTTGQSTLTRLDSLSGMSSLLEGGDNILAMEITPSDSINRGVAMVFDVLVDTTEQFERTVEIPRGKRSPGGGLLAYGQKSVGDTSGAVGTDEQAGEATEPAVSDTASSGLAGQYKSRAELQTAIDEYRKREQEASLRIRRQRMELQKLRIRTDDVAEQVQQVRQEIEDLKSKLSQASGG